MLLRREKVQNYETFSMKPIQKTSIKIQKFDLQTTIYTLSVCANNVVFMPSLRIQAT